MERKARIINFEQLRKPRCCCHHGPFWGQYPLPHGQIFAMLRTPMKTRVYVQEFLEAEPMFIEMRSAPKKGDLLDSRRYGACEVVDVISTPSDPRQDALIRLQIRVPFELLW
jgi:hypothetical protein